MNATCALALAAALALTASVAGAQENVFKMGITYYQPHSQTDGISGIGVPPGADADVGSATTVVAPATDAPGVYLLRVCPQPSSPPT